MKIAIYGKGGIGKSTISANLSAALAETGQKVLQIGCDPKHDSTRLLLNGRIITTVLDYMKTVPPMRRKLSDLLHTGYQNTTCAEAGGPEPGVGCAGRGILSMFTLFSDLGLHMDDYDIVLFDVLGDVVCGGFAVPLRKGFADQVYVVTSEEFMAVYAANNILKGVGNFDNDHYRMAGLILNSRGGEERPAPVERFSEATGIPLISRFPRSDVFRKAEQNNRTILEMFPESPEASMFRTLARHICNNRRLYPSKSLTDSQLAPVIYEKTEIAALEKMDAPRGTVLPLSPRPQKKAPPENGFSPPPAGLLSKSMLFREPLHGCSFTGAICTTVQVKNAVTVVHGPKSCAHIAHRTVLASGIRTRVTTGNVLPGQLAPALISSDMDEAAVIYGGEDNLRVAIQKALDQHPEVVFVITACPPGIIGDDPEAVIRKIQLEQTGIPIIPIDTDGNINGDYMQGVINACFRAASALIDPHVTPQKDRVNILAEKNIANNAETNFTTIAGLLSALDIEVNCRFMRDTSFEQLHDFLKAPLNLLAYDDHLGRVLKTFFTDTYQARFAIRAFPVGFYETEAWLTEIAGFFGKEENARSLIEKYREYYKKQVKKIGGRLAGKRLMIISYIHDVDWILEAAFDLNMIVEKVGILNYSQDYIFRTRFKDVFPVETGYTAEKRNLDLMKIKPDLLLCNYVPQDLPVAVHMDGIPLCPDTGFFGALTYAGRWESLVKTPVREGWRDDG